MRTARRTLLRRTVQGNRRVWIAGRAKWLLAVLLPVFAAAMVAVIPGAAEVIPGFLFLVAVIGVTVLTGRGPGLLAMLLSTTALVLFVGRHEVERPWWLLWTGVFVGLGGLAVIWVDSLLAEAARRAVAVLDPLVESSPVGIALFDRELRFVRVNAAMVTLLRQPDGNYVGRPVTDVVPMIPEDLIDRLRAVLATGALLRNHLVEARRPDGAVARYVVDAFPVRLAGPEEPVTGLGAVVMDVTERYRLQQLERAAAAAEVREQARVIDLFQRGMLPTRLPTIAGAELAAEYLAVADRIDVGGDWYDAFPLPDGRIALSVGDVIGHDQQAATIMGQVRAIGRGYAIELPDPGSVLTRLNRLLALTYPSGTLVSAVAGVYDPGTGALAWANAGHPYPMLAAAERVRVLESHDPILGATADRAYLTHTIELPAAGTLLCYTDGLIERRGTDLEEAQDSLAALLGKLTCDPAVVGARAVVDGVTAGSTDHQPPDDDVCVLVLRRDP